ncbi:MAG: ABC transporter substrate-binding protein [Anaerolineaceae bacterium]|jgi:NitT/TauT family transport system substrate-binding protein|nr:ABC transporter substrate-binding protein [Anaerolineaceae bacterium]
MKKIAILGLLAVMLLAGCAPAAAPQDGPTAIRLPVGYIPNVQFAPLYVAMDKGYYTDAGLDVTIDYSFEVDGVALVGANQLQFAVASGEQVLLGREQGLPIVYVMTWYEEYPVGVAALADSGIESLDDLRGRSIGTPVLSGASYIGLRALLEAGNLSEKDITLDTIGFSQVEMLTTGREDAIVVYVANEPVQLAAQGYDVNVIPVSEHVHLVGNGLITNEETIREHPELVRAMVAATLHGLRDAQADPQEAFEISTKYVENLDQVADVQRQVLAESIKLWTPDGSGVSDLAAWENMQELLLKMGLMSKPLDLTQIFSNDFLPE